MHRPSKSERHLYENGMCGVLAWALWEAYGGKSGRFVLGNVYDRYDQYDRVLRPSHALFCPRIPREQRELWIDVNGPALPASKRRKWRFAKAHITYVDDPEEYYSRFVDDGLFIGKPYDLDAARELVERCSEFFGLTA